MSMRIIRPVLGLWILLMGVATSTGVPADIVRVGVLQYGSVHWELEVIRHHGLLEGAEIELEIVPFGSTHALNVALQGRRVDIIVNDWIWVSRQRAEGRDFTSVPYSLTVGSLMVHPESGIAEFSDLRGQRLGVAGGPVDKGWLLLRAYAIKVLGADLADLVVPSFAGPPILAELMLKGDIPAVLNFWQYSARLQAAGMRPLIEVIDVLPELGIDRPVPLLVWVFSEGWAERNRPLAEAFLDGSYAAKRLLDASDLEWERIAPLTLAEDEATLTALRTAYRRGIPERFGPAEHAAAEEVFRILALLGGRELVGRSSELASGTFWNYVLR